MRTLTSFVAGMAAGALAMYYLDASSGARRRTLARDKLVATGRDVSDHAQHKGRHVADHVKGVAATGRLDRVSRRAPESDQQLHERIRSRLGRLLDHPGSVHVEVQDGHVRLTGHVMASELDRLLDDLRRLPGVEAVQNALAAHDGPDHVPELQGARSRT